MLQLSDEEVSSNAFSPLLGKADIWNRISSKYFLAVNAE